MHAKYALRMQPYLGSVWISYFSFLLILSHFIYLSCNPAWENTHTNIYFSTVNIWAKFVENLPIQQSGLRRLRSACASAQADLSLHWPHEVHILFFDRTEKALISLRIYKHRFVLIFIGRVRTKTPFLMNAAQNSIGRMIGSQWKQQQSAYYNYWNENILSRSCVNAKLCKADLHVFTFSYTIKCISICYYLKTLFPVKKSTILSCSPTAGENLLNGRDE